MSSATPSPSHSAAATLQAPGNLKVVGIILAIASGVLIGSSFVFKKKGLINSQKGGVAGEGVAYLKSPLWWTGMIMMILGELCNFAAYAFVEAIVVTPMGALSVVICAILSSFFLKEKLTFFGWLGCGLCIIGSVIIALNGPQEAAVGQITEFQKLFLAPGFLVYGSILIAASLVIIFFVAPKYGTQSMLWYILVCSMIGGISVSVTTGLGSAIVTTAMGDNQFKHWFIYFLMVFIAVTLVTEVFYLNKALALFNTAMVTPTYYVIFTFFSIITTIVLFKGLKAPVPQIITLVMGFIVICFGITILQLSKVDPTEIKTLDRRSTLLLQAAQRNTEGFDEKHLSAVEDPGMDALRGSFGTIGSIVRAKSARRMSMSSRNTSTLRSRRGVGSEQFTNSYDYPHQGEYVHGMKRHQLYDPPVPHREPSADRVSLASQNLGSGLPAHRVQTIKFGEQDLVHQYHLPGTGDDSATHEARPSYIPQLSARSAQPQELTTTVEDHEDEYGLRSAPPMLTDLDNDDPFRRPHVIDPFAGSPSTTTIATFPSISSVSTISATPSEGDSLRAVVGAVSPEVKAPIGALPPPSSVSPSNAQLCTKTSSGGTSSSHQHHLFGRHPGGGRKYPRGDQQDDREESVSLFPAHGADVDVEARGESPSPPIDMGEAEFGEDFSKKSIRLVPSQNRF